jgi:FkbM family methyltransferase
MSSVMAPRSSLRKVRDALAPTVLESLCWATRHLYRVPAGHDGLVSRVFRGPLRGRWLALPEHYHRPSFSLGLFEPHVVEAMRHHVRPGAVAYDVGANVGYHTLYLADLVGPSGKVLAFEPNPSDHARLQWNVQANQARSVRILNQAVAAASGTVSFATFEVAGIHRIATGEVPADAKMIQVPAVSLDDFVYAHGNPTPDFIKIDVEGGEDEVLRGAARLLAAARPVIICEVWSSNADCIKALCSAHGYIQQSIGGHGGLEDVLLKPPPQSARAAPDPA